MAYELFDRIALREDFPEYGLCKEDVATIVDTHQPVDDRETGYSLEVFNAIGETIAVLVVAESQIEPLMGNEVLSVRPLGAAALRGTEAYT